MRSSITPFLICTREGLAVHDEWARFSGDGDFFVEGSGDKRVGGNGGPRCSVPWKSLYIHSNGKFFPCCVIRGSIGAQKDLSFSEVWHGPEMVGLRAKLLGDGEIPECRSCWHREKNGVRSRRMLFQRDFGDVELEADPLRPSLNQVKHFDISFGNLCNLACLFCSSDKSSKWEAIDKAFQDDPFYAEHRRCSLGNTEVDTERLTEDILKLEDLNVLEIKGGEPLIHPAHARLLERLIKVGRAGRMNLLYSTNLTHLPEKMLELWSQFKLVDLAISIDGTESIQKYIRGDKASLEKTVLPNLKRLRHLKNVRVTSHTTICAYNFSNLEALIEYLNSDAIGISVNSVGLVQSPNYLSPYILKRDEVEDIIENMKTSKYSVLKNLAHSLNIELFGADVDLIAKFEKFTKDMDAFKAAGKTRVEQLF